MESEGSGSMGRGLFGAGTNRSFYLPRLPREYYQGDAVVHWTMSLSNRATGWLTEQFHLRFREMMLHVAAREHLFCPTYCLMRDHMHFTWMGLHLESDQLNGIKFLRDHVGRVIKPLKFQHQAHDHVLRQEQRKRGVFAIVCFYIIDNARAAGLVSDPKEWPYAGAILPGYPDVHPLNEKFWPLFWRLYGAARSPDAGNTVRPPIDGK